MIEFVAELGQTMHGDVGLAVEMVHAFAEAGATHIKVQMLRPETIATADAGSYWQTGPEVLQRESFEANGIIAYDAWGPVRAACDEAKIGFVATPFDLEAVAALDDLDPAAVKIASGDITFEPLLMAVSRLGRRVFLSTGAATRSEVTNALVVLWRWSSDIVPFACTLAYPTPVEEAHLSRLRALAQHCPRVGYSDHTLGTAAAMYAVLAGATVLEKHVTPRTAKTAVVPDDRMGLGPKEFRQYVGDAQAAVMLLGDESFEPAPVELAARAGARRAARYARDLPRGHLLALDDFTFLRPDPDGTGSSIGAAMAALGQRVAAGVEAGATVDYSDVIAVDVPF